MSYIILYPFLCAGNSSREKGGREGGGEGRGGGSIPGVSTAQPAERSGRWAGAARCALRRPPPPPPPPLLGVLQPLPLSQGLTDTGTGHPHPRDTEEPPQRLRPEASRAWRPARWGRCSVRPPRVLRASSSGGSTGKPCGDLGDLWPPPPRTLPPQVSSDPTCPALSPAGPSRPATELRPSSLPSFPKPPADQPGSPAG